MRSILIKVVAQTLFLEENGKSIKSYPISTAKAGVGQKKGSYKTPLGRHEVYAKIGKNAIINAVFVGRKPTGEIYIPSLANQYPDRDWILTRILWLSGLEQGVNLGGDVDTKDRHIYIHGCPDEISFEKPSSHGCVRMKNQDIIELFDSIKLKALVTIEL